MATDFSIPILWELIEKDEKPGSGFRESHLGMMLIDPLVHQIISMNSHRLCLLDEVNLHHAFRADFVDQEFSIDFPFLIVRQQSPEREDRPFKHGEHADQVCGVKVSIRGVSVGNREVTPLPRFSEAVDFIRRCFE